MIHWELLYIIFKKQKTKDVILGESYVREERFIKVKLYVK